MIIEMTDELSAIIKSELLWMEEYAKNYELSRRASASSICKTEAEKKKYETASEDFVYVLEVDGNRVQLVRVPPTDQDPTINDIAVETEALMNAHLSDLTHDSIASSDKFKNFIAEHVIKPYIIEKATEGVNQ